MFKSSLHSSVRFMVSWTQVACCVVFMINHHARLTVLILPEQCSESLRNHLNTISKPFVR